MTLDQIPAPGSDAGRAALAEPEPLRTPGPPEPSGGRTAWYRHLRRPYVVIPAVGAVAFAVWFVAFRSTGSSSSATTTTTKQLVTVTRGALTNNVSAEGTVAAAQTDNLSFSSAGTVTAVNVKAGDAVSAGEVLATINSASLQSAVASAASTLAKAQATLSDDEAAGASSDQINADQTSVTTATDSLTRAWQGLAGASLVATFNGTVASVNLTVGEQLASSGSGGTTPTGSATGSGQSSSTLGSGNSGGLGGNGNSNSNNSSSSSSAQIQVVSKGQYTVSLPVGSNDISSIKAGETATLTVTTGTGGRFGGFGGGGGFFRFFGGGGGGGGGGAGAANGNGNANGANRGGNGTGNGQNGNGQNGSGSAANTGATATGTVTDVSQVATASSGVAQYPVTVTFATDNAQFSVGSTVTGAVQTVVANDVLQVPVRAVTTDSNGRSTVTVSLDGSTNGRTATRTVQTGRTAGGMIEITSGLKEGDQVIVTTVLPAGATTGGTGTRGTSGGNGQFPGLGTGGAGGGGTGGGGTRTGTGGG